MIINNSFQPLNSLVSLVPNLWFGVHAGTSGSLVKWQKIIPTLLLLSAIFSTTIIAQTPNFDQLKYRFDTGQVFKAEFDHTYTDSYTEEVVSSEGNIWIDKERYKLESDGQTIVVDGKTSRVYDSDRNRVIVDTYNPEDDDFAPSRMLSGIDSTYTVSEKRNGSNTIITLQTDDDFAVFTRVEILINSDDIRPLKITAWDISDNKIETTFANGIFLGPEEGLFKLESPEDAEIVDMRY